MIRRPTDGAGIKEIRRSVAPIACFVALWCLVAAAGCQSKKPPPPPQQDERAIVTSRAREVLEALKAKDMPRLAALVHPTLGVRFSAAPYVHADSDRVFSRAEVATLWANAKEFMWGIADGSGDSIVLSFPNYYPRYVFGHDFTQAPQTAYTSGPIRGGNAPSNLSTVYPDARWIEYHFPGFDPKYSGMDWSSLWLVFLPSGDDWFLVGVVHGRWTI